MCRVHSNTALNQFSCFIRTQEEQALAAKVMQGNKKSVGPKFKAGITYNLYLLKHQVTEMTTLYSVYSLVTVYSHYWLNYTLFFVLNKHWVMTEIGLTINDILSFNSLFAQGLQVIRIHCQTPWLCLQVLSTGLQLSPQQSIMGIWMRHKKSNPEPNVNKACALWSYRYGFHLRMH